MKISKFNALKKLALTCVASSFCYANQATFGLKINKATKEEFAKKINIQVSDSIFSY
ncbi:MAG: hypothetical protein SOW25_02400 [Helicobacter sp.]|nr:hypothetical protein [Helicobacter sp.]